MSLLTYQIQQLIQADEYYDYYFEDLTEIRMRLNYWILELMDAVEDLDDELGDSDDED